HEVMQRCSELLQELHEPERRTALLVQLGEWYRTRVHRLELALQCYQSVLRDDPGNAPAADGLIDIYRKAQQWADLAQLLVDRGKTLPPPRNRDLMVEAATVYADRLSDQVQAKHLLEQVL